MPVQTITQTASAVSTRTKIIATAVAVAALGGIAAGLTPLYTNKPDLQVRAIQYNSQPGIPGVVGSGGIFTNTTITNAGRADVIGSNGSNVSSPVNVIGKDFYLGFDFFDGANKLVNVTPGEVFFNPATNPDFSLNSSPSRPIRFLVKNGLKAGAAKSVIFTMLPPVLNSKHVVRVVAVLDPTNAVDEGAVDSATEKNNNLSANIPVEYRIFAPDYQVTGLQINQNVNDYSFTLKYKNAGLTYGQGWIGLSATDARGLPVAINSDMIKFDGYPAITDYNQSTQFAAVRMPDTYSTDEKTLTGTIKGSLKTAGVVSITAKADISDVVTEISEANNQMTVNLPVTELKPDLTVTAPVFTVSSTGEVKFSLSNKNVGNANIATAAALGFTAKKYDGTDIPITAGDLLMLSGIPMQNVNNVWIMFNLFPLKPNESLAFNGTITKQLLAKGISELYVQTDFNSSIIELSEANNTSFAALPSSVIVRALPPKVTMSEPTTISSTGATWNASVNPNGAATTGWFRHTSLAITKCEDDSQAWRLPGGSVASTDTSGYSLGSTTTETKLYALASGLTPGKTYYVCAYANNAGGKSASDVYKITMPPTSTLKTSISNNNPVPRTLIAGTSNNEMAMVQFTASGEAFVVDQLTITNDPTKDDDYMYKSVSIKYPDQAGIGQDVTAFFVNGLATFSNLKLYVPNNGIATINLKGNLAATPGGAPVNQTTLLGLDGDSSFRAVGQLSNFAIDQSATGIIDVNGNTFTVSEPTQGTLTFSLNNTSPTGIKIPGPNTEIIRFNATLSASANDMQISEITLILSADDLNNSNWVCNKNSSLKVYTLSDPTLNLAGTPLLGTGCAVNKDVTTYVIPLTQSVSLVAGSTKTFSIKIDTTGATQTDTLNTTVQNVGSGYSGTSVGPLVTGIPLTIVNGISF